jgi:thimet oligopeptidase
MQHKHRPWASLLLAGTALSAGGAYAATPIDTQVTDYLKTLALLPVSVKDVDDRCARTLSLSTQAQTTLEARKGPATIKGDMAAFDTLTLIIGDGVNEMYLVSETNTSADIRAAAEACVSKISEVSTAVSLSRPIYDRLAAIPQTGPNSGLDSKTGFTLKKILTNYKLSGVDKDEATRAAVTRLQKEITDTGLLFAKNIRDDKGDIAFRPEELKGLPQDYIEGRKPGPDGFVHISFAYPDILPLLDYADIRETRRKAITAFSNRGWPANEAVLKTLLEKRYTLAQTLGYPDYATYITADKMIGTPQRAAAFLDEVNEAAKPGANADYGELLAFAKTVDPSITKLERYDAGYMSNLLRKQKYDVDSQEVRAYFTLNAARTGIFKLVSDLFDADIRPWDTPVWDKSVTAWSLYDKGKLIGHFYLDLSPREGKYNHAAHFSIRTGVAGRQVPVSALICNFPASGPMDHEDVTTFLHEFGHLIHNLYSGHPEYANQSMGNLQWDFIEAPSQLLEEWTWNYDTLKSFAANDKGEPIPETLVKKMNAGRHFGEAGGWQSQLGIAAVSLNFYNRKPDFDLLTEWNVQRARYSLYSNLPGTHGYASLGHLDGYSAIYYTYVWSKAIALDLFTQFEANGIRDKATAMRYRKLVLEPGGSEDANVLIHNFLGRPLSLEALKTELQKK